MQAALARGRAARLLGRGRDGRLRRDRRDLRGRPARRSPQAIEARLAGGAEVRPRRSRRCCCCSQPSGSRPPREPAAVARPRLFVAERDPFAGLPALRARWAAGERPSDGPAGPRALLAPLGRRVLRAPRARGAPGRPADRLEGLEPLRPLPEPRDGLRLALRLRGLRRRAQGPGGGGPRGRGRADARAARRSRTRPRPRTTTTPRASWPSPSSRWPRSRATRRWRPGRRRCARRPGARFDNLLEQTELVNPDGGYHESTDYMRITWAPLAMMAEVRRTTTGEDPATRWSVFRNMGLDLPLQGAARRQRGPRRRQRVPAPRLAGQRRARLRRPPLQGPLRGLAAAAARVAPRRLGEPGARSSCGSDADGRAARSRHDDRERAAAPAALPRHRPPRAARRLGPGLHLDPARLRPLLREARPPRRGAPRRLPQGLPGDRRRRRLHRHREPALPQPLPAHASPTTRCSSTSPASPSSGARTAGRPPTTAASAWTRRASGTACGASRTGAARGTSGTAAGSLRWPRSPRTATRAPTPRAPTSRRSSSASRASSCTCASRTCSSSSTACARRTRRTARPGCSTA